MTKRKIWVFYFLITILLISELRAQTLDRQVRKLSDAPNDDDSSKCLSSSADSVPYEIAMKNWKTVIDVNNWIQINFRYSIERAKQLVENSSERETTGIYTPAQFYQTKKGVCINLSRFAVETINTVDTSKHAQYLMIEFEPLIIDGMVIKKHWLAIYEHSLGYYILADSKRPGLISGPYKNVDDFILEYQNYRGRKIVSWKILLSYKKKKKVK